MTGTTPTRPTITDALAEQAIAAATEAARSQNTPITVVVVDESGVLKAARRMDDAPLVSLQTATNKAYAAAAIGMPPDDFYTAISADPAAVASFASRPGLALIAGGMPVLVEGRIAGAVGVAGAMTGAQDRAFAEAAAQAARPHPTRRAETA